MARQDGDAEIIKEAKARFERCVTWEASARANALRDTKMSEGDAYNLYQWEQDVRTARGGRPTLTDNQIRQNNLLIVNDARQNKAQIKVTPTGGNATFEAAQIYSGIVRRIEYQSKAIDAYSTGIFHQVQSGIGYARVVTDYADADSFDQEIFIRRVPDPKSVYLDPDAKDYDRADMRFAFVFDDVPRDRYEAEYGKTDMPAPAALDNASAWNDRDHVRVAEYWCRSDQTDTLHRLVDGSVMRESDMQGDLGKLQKAQSVDSREITLPQIEWYKICGDRIDDRKSWPGKYIPIVPFVGEETVIDTVMDRKGHTRSQIDAQRMVNYWTSAAVEHVALQGKSPYIAPVRAIEGLEKYWDTANTKNHAVLPFNDVDDTGVPIAAPVRMQPPEMAPAYLHGLQMAKDALMMVTGQYQANRGAPSNETSGVAIQQRQRAGDAATYHFVDNQAKAIRQIGRIVLDLIPKVYDVAQVTKIMAEDGTESDVHIDPGADAAHQHVQMGPGGPQPITPEQAMAADNDPDAPDVRVIFNPNVGRYDVEADVGPAFATRRQEAFNALSEIIKASPDLVHVAGDLLFKSADFPLADELAARLKRGVPPQFLGGPTLAVQQVQQQLQQTSQQAHDLLGKADAEISDLKQQLAAAQLAAKDKSAGTGIDDYKAETERLKAVAAADPAAAQVLIRSMLSDLLGMPALPIMHEHQAADAEHQQAIMPPPAPGQVNGASPQQS